MSSIFRRQPSQRLQWRHFVRRETADALALIANEFWEAPAASPAQPPKSSIQMSKLLSPVFLRGRL